MESLEAVEDAPSVAIFTYEPAVNVLLEAGVKLSVSPSAEPEKATVIVPIVVGPLELETVKVESATVIAVCKTVVTLVSVQALVIGTKTKSAVDTSAI